jgi:hypothetical protein
MGLPAFTDKWTDYVQSFQGPSITMTMHNIQTRFVQMKPTQGLFWVKKQRVPVAGRPTDISAQNSLGCCWNHGTITPLLSSSNSNLALLRGATCLLAVQWPVQQLPMYAAPPYPGHPPILNNSTEWVSSKQPSYLDSSSGWTLCSEIHNSLILSGSRENN